MSRSKCLEALAVILIHGLAVVWRNTLSGAIVTLSEYFISIANKKKRSGFTYPPHCPYRGTVPAG